jgi:hypothetical protein
LGEESHGSAVSIRRIDQTRAQVIGVYNQRLKPGKGEEFLLAVGPAVKELYPSLDLKPGVQRGVADEVVMRLHPPPLPRWAFLTTTGVAAGLGALGAGTLYVAQMKAQDYNDYAARGVPPNQPIDGTVLASKRDDATKWKDIGLGLAIGAGVVIVAAGIEALFTDWNPAPASAAL